MFERNPWKIRGLIKISNIRKHFSTINADIAFAKGGLRGISSGWASDRTQKIPLTPFLQRGEWHERVGVFVHAIALNRLPTLTMI
jgi:hypothetical protein